MARPRPDDREAALTKQTRCPKCNAELPAKGQFCLECGLDLYGEGIRHAPRPWPAILLTVLFAGAIAYLATRPPTPKLAPENEEVAQLTQGLLRLVAEGKCREAVRRFYVPDVERFDKTGAALREIVRGQGAPGLNLFRATCMDDMEEAKKFVQRFGAEHPAYVVQVLAALVFQDGALRTSLGGTQFGSQRTEDFLAWYLDLAFRDVDTSLAQVLTTRWQDSAGGERLLVASVRYPAPPNPLPGVADVTSIAWRRLADGRWVFAVGDQPRLDEVLALLMKAKL
jgi:hypothetical protein